MLATALTAVALGLAGGPVRDERVAKDEFLAIRGGRILTMAGAALDGGVILVKNGRIAAVGRNVRIPRAAVVIDAREKYVMPGVIDAMSFFGTRPFAANVPEAVTPENRIIEAFRPFGALMRGPGGVQPEPELLCGGVTAVYIAPGSGQLIGGQGAVVKTDGRDFDSLVLRDPASVDMAIAYAPPGAAGTSSPPSRLRSLGLLQKTLKSAAEYRKSFEDFVKKSARDKATAAAPARDAGKDVLARLLSREIPARIEADLPEDILNAVRIAEEFGFKLVIDGGIGAREVRKMLAEKKIPVVIRPLSNPLAAVRGCDHDELRGIEDERLAAWLTEAGVKVAISSRSAENGGSGQATQGRWLLLEAALAAGAGLSEEEALKAVTINAAEILGVADRVGSLVPGKDGDVVILSGHPLRMETRVEQVFVGGRLSFARGAANASNGGGE